MPHLEECPRGHTLLMDEGDMDFMLMSTLHKAAYDGSAERTAFEVARREFDIDVLTPEGMTPLMLAAARGASSVATILLSAGADARIKTSDGVTALLLAAVNGHLAATKVLLASGANPEVSTFQDCRALHLTAHLGFLEVMRVLIDAGANINARKTDGSTPLFAAALVGQVGSTRVLLHAKANPQLATFGSDMEPVFVPLDAAAENGHPGVVRELIQSVGLRGCGGENDGVTALHLAAQEQLLDVVALLTDLGVVDTGRALIATAGHAREAPMKLLLETHTAKFAGRRGYVNARNPFGATPMLCCIEGGSCSPRIARILIDAGADTTSRVRVADGSGVVHSNDTPLDATVRVLDREKALVNGGLRDTEARGGLNSLEATRRLLLRVEAVHAVSWLWPTGVPCCITNNNAAAAAAAAGAEG